VWGLGTPMNVVMYERWFCTPADLLDIDPTRARNLIVECFFEAHHEAMTRSNALRGLDTDPDLVRMEALGAVLNAFKRTGGDFNNPDKASLIRVVGSLAGSASVLGTPKDIIQHHKQQIAIVLAALPD
jgi:hypothetical protein